MGAELLLLSRLPEMKKVTGAVLGGRSGAGGEDWAEIKTLAVWGDDGVGLRPPAHAGHVDDGLTEVVRVDGDDGPVGWVSVREKC